MRGQDAVAGTQVVAAVGLLQGQILFPAGQLGEGGGETGVSPGSRRLVLVENGHYGGREHVHSEEAEVVAGPETGDDEVLFRLGGRGLLEDQLDAVKVGVAGDALASDSSETGKAILAGGHHGRDGAALRGGDLNQLLGTAGFGLTDPEMIADQVEKGVLADELAGAVDRMGVTERLGLGHEGEARRVVAGDVRVFGFVTRKNDDADLLDARAAGFGDLDGQDGFLGSVAVDKGLQGEPALLGSGGGDDSFRDFHDGASLGGGTE